MHVEALKRVGVNVLGVLGSSPAKSRAAAEAMGLSKAYSSYDELLQDGGVHAVHLTVPNRLHSDRAVHALHAGMHVMCEKPLARKGGFLPAASSGVSAA